VETRGRITYSLITEGMIEEKLSRERLIRRYISQITKSATVASYRELNDMANDKEI